MSFLNRAQLEKMGFAAFGEDVLISDKCSIYGAAHIRLGDHVRIDDMTVITAGEPVTLGSYVHLGPQVFLNGTQGLQVEDFVSLAAGVKVFTVSNDYSGRVMASIDLPDEVSGFDLGPVHIGRYVIIGAQSVILPGVTLGEGAAVGALSLVKTSLEPWSIYAGAPARIIRPRSREMLDLAADFLREHDAARHGG